MRLFISYARVDKPYCIQIVDTLDAHEIWYDDRLYAGQNWWKEILRRLDWCEGFVYLLSPESIESTYCRREYELAKSLGRHIFPVLVQPDTSIPTSLADIQYVDLSEGLTPDGVKTLLNSIYRKESHGYPKFHFGNQMPESNPMADLPSHDPADVIAMAAEAMEDGQFDQAVYILRQAKENGYESRFIKIDAILSEAEKALSQQMHLREAKRDYNQIAVLVRTNRTFQLGQKAFEEFRKVFTDYDPDNLTGYIHDANNGGGHSNNGHSRDNYISTSYILSAEALPMLKWCEIPAGRVNFKYTDKDKRSRDAVFAVDSFYISKYPVTNAQYAVFLEDPHGYNDSRWWDFSPHAMLQRQQKPEPVQSTFKGNERPREMVSWYDAIAFCRWLSKRLDLTITLPTLAEWQYAYQGDDNRQFPWGNQFEKAYANTAESELKMTSVVNSYPQNISPFNVCDMAGNVWEWCLNLNEDDNFNANLHANGKRMVRGGSFMSPADRSMVSFCYSLKPEIYYSSIGFRIAWKYQY